MSDNLDERVRALMQMARPIASDHEHAPMCFLLLSTGDIWVCPLVDTADRVQDVRAAITAMRAAGATVEALVWISEAWLSMLDERRGRAPGADLLEEARAARLRCETLVVTIDRHLGASDVYVALLGRDGGEGKRKLGAWLQAPGLVDSNMIGLLGDMDGGAHA